MKLTLLLLVLLDCIEDTSSVPNLTQLAASINKLNSEVKILNKKKAALSNYCNLYAKGKCGECVCMVDYNVRNKYYCDCTNLKSKRDCLQFYQHGYHIDGVYQVTMNGFANRLVYCDQTNNNGGWTVIQRRYDSSTDFYRNWNEYKYGFGELQREFWLGNDNIHLLTLQAMYPKGSEALIKINEFGNTNPSIMRYSDIQVGNEKTNYMIAVSGSSGFYRSSDFILNNKNEFTTYDNDNDKSTSENCAKTYNGAWWYSDCSHEEVNLNGEYNKHGRIKTEHAFSWGHYNLE